ncbi:MAG: bifunctional glutamate N-acetyltransferase/amino-acid acetyltransferase ArgJ [Vicinamibacteria bacterium]|nr:bifunctional glutamate N-acetyltransferase/amino-acid acetyltransferase ArgJ [Vicinamibacteria bacterium]
MSTGVTAPRGFRAIGAMTGIKKESLDLAVIAADELCSAAAVFTRNRAQAAPILVSREHVASGQARAVVVNAGCANAATGARGIADAREMAALTATDCGCLPREVLVASTGVIGTYLPMEKLRAGIPRAVAALSPEGGAVAARAILTTDTCPKEIVVELEIGGVTARIGAMAKGAGMLAPNMATMLAFITTDIRVGASLLDRALHEAVDAGLNRITVDGDTSTNDTTIVLSGGASGAPPIETEGAAFDAFRKGLREVSFRLAQLLIRDGEGATRVAEIRVERAASDIEADRVARTIAESPLVKTALHGGDANWGRILAAAGRSGVELDASRVDIFLGDVWVAEGGRARDYDESQATRAVVEEPILIRVRLNRGDASGSIWTCDLGPGYVEINGSYRS